MLKQFEEFKAKTFETMEKMQTKTNEKIEKMQMTTKSEIKKVEEIKVVVEEEFEDFEDEVKKPLKLPYSVPPNKNKSRNYPTKKLSNENIQDIVKQLKTTLFTKKDTSVVLQNMVSAMGKTLPMRKERDTNLTV